MSTCDHSVYQPSCPLVYKCHTEGSLLNGVTLHEGQYSPPPRSCKLSNKRPSARCRILLLELSDKGVPTPPQSIQSIAIALDCSTELDGIAELLKRPHSNYRTCRNQGGAATLKAIHQRGNLNTRLLRRRIVNSLIHCELSELQS